MSEFLYPTHADQLQLKVFSSRKEMGIAASDWVAKKIISYAENQESVRMIFAAAVSQSEFLAHFRNRTDIPWEKIIAFHMDEYIGLDQQAPQRFGNFLRTSLFNHIPFKEVHFLNESGNNANEDQRYTSLLMEQKIDICCMGIGENGHLAFNDPPVADFNDPRFVKAVELDIVCRQQQVNDGAFSVIEEVPKQALTLTIPALMSAKSVSVVVPGRSKSNAVADTIKQKINEAFPSTILRKHPDAFLFLDQESAIHLSKS